MLGAQKTNDMIWQKKVTFFTHLHTALSKQPTIQATSWMNQEKSWTSRSIQLWKFIQRPMVLTSSGTTPRLATQVFLREAIQQSWKKTNISIALTLKLHAVSTTSISHSSTYVCLEGGSPISPQGGLHKPPSFLTNDT